MRIESVKIDKFSLAESLKKPDESTAKVIKLAKSANINLEKLLPKEPIYNVSFIIDDAPVSLPNAFRRIFIDYIDCRILQVNMYDDFDTDDKFLTCDRFNHNLGCIHINQEGDEKISGSIDISNTTRNELMTVRTSDIKLKGAKITCDYPIGYLRPGKYLKVRNIYAMITSGFADGRAKAVSGRLVYKCLDQVPFNVKDGTGESSLLANPRKFMVGYRTHRNGDKPLWPFNRACENIINSCKSIKDAIENDNILKAHVVKLMDAVEYEFYDEYLTITDLLRDYILDKVPECQRIASSIKSYEENIGILLISHPDHKKIIIDACDNIIQDVMIIAKKVN